MKYLLAFIPPDLLHRVKDALITKHVHGMTVSEARGFGQEHDAGPAGHGDLWRLDLARKVRIEVICHDEEVDAALQAFYAAGHTGHAGDGKIFVLPVLDALRLRTGERGPSALGPPV